MNNNNTNNMNIINIIIACLQAIGIYGTYFGFNIMWNTLDEVHNVSKYPDGYVPPVTYKVILLPDEKESESWDEKKIAYALQAFNDYICNVYLPKTEFPFYKIINEEKVIEILYFTGIEVNSFGLLTLEITVINCDLDYQYVQACIGSLRRFLL